MRDVRAWLRKRAEADTDSGAEAQTPLAAPAPFEYQVKLQEAVPGVEVEAPGRGRAYLIETPVAKVAECPAWVSQSFCAALRAADSGLCARLAARCGVAGLTPADLVFVDLETTGLSCSSPLFLIGAMVWDAGGFVVKQYLARHYGEEAAVTALFLELASAKQLIVSFNGKSFDIPYVRMRAAANTMPCRLDHPHFDMLREARRVWGSTLPNCRLQTLEQYLCGRVRYDDIPGRDIPAAYHHFVRTENAYQIVQILKHNLLDLVTLAELMLQLPPLAEASAG